jgi:hypothetical protein
MQACVEVSAPPAAGLAPAWTLRVARPSAGGRGMSQALHCVPKSALETILGKDLGRRLWNQLRSPASARPTDGVPDSAVATAMLEYVSHQAAGALQKAERQAKGLALTITYANGEKTITRTRMAQATNVANEIADTATKLLHQVALHDAGIAAIRLSMTTIDTAVIRETPDCLPCSMRQAIVHA